MSLFLIHYCLWVGIHTDSFCLRRKEWTGFPLSITRRDWIIVFSIWPWINVSWICNYFISACLLRVGSGAFENYWDDFRVHSSFIFFLLVVKFGFLREYFLLAKCLDLSVHGNWEISKSVHSGFLIFSWWTMKFLGILLVYSWFG